MKQQKKLAVTLFAVAPLLCGVGLARAQDPATTQPQNDPAEAGAPASTVSTQTSTPQPSVGDANSVPLPASAPEAAQPYPNVVSLPPETPATPQSAEKTGNRFIQEVIVTAQKRAENLQDVPISVSAFSADMLDAKGIDNPADLQKVTPGLNFSSAVGFSVIYLRGIGSDAFLMADPSVATYIDGIYYPFAQGLSQNFGAVERVEVLKGPQGTLFGRNAVGGAINIITKAPESYPESEIQVGYGQFSDLKTRAYTNLPITDDLAVNMSVFYNKGESAYEHHGSTSGGDALPDEIAKGARLKVKWSPSDMFDVTGAVLRLQQSGVGSLFTPNTDPSTLLGAVIPAQTGYRADLSSPVFSNLDNTVFYGQANGYFDWFDVRLLGSHQSINTHYGYDFDGSNLPLVGFEAKKQYANVSSAEFQILSNKTSWASDWLTWIGGAYYFTSRQGFDPVELRLLDLNLTTGQIGPLDLSDTLVTRILDVLPDGLTPTGAVALRALIDTDSIAGFAQLTAKMTDWASLTIGARYQAEKHSVAASSSSLELASGDLIPLFDFSNGQNETTKSFKPKVSLELRPKKDVLVYLSFQQALKSGTYNVVTLYDAPDYVKPEKLDAYEIGVKSSFFHHLVSLNAAAFQYNLKDQQVQFVSLIQGGAISFENAGAARIRGVDFDALIQLFPSHIDDLVVTASGAYLHGIYTDYDHARGYNANTGLSFKNGDYTGNDTVRTPSFSGLVGLSKTFHIASGSIELAGDFYYNSGFYYSPQNEKSSYQPHYSTTGAHVSYLYAPWGMRFTVFGSNLTDERYTLGRFSTDFGRLDYLTPPRTFGGRINWQF